MHSLVAIATTQEQTTTSTTTATTTTTATNYNHNHRILQQIPIQKPQQSYKKIIKKKPQNLQQNRNPTDQSMTKLNQPLAARSTARAVEDDK